MTKQKGKWSKYYLTSLGILLLALIYFIFPLIREDKFFYSFINIIKKYNIDTILNYIILPVNKKFNSIEKTLTNSQDNQGMEELQNQVINLKRQLKIKNYLIQQLNHIKDENEMLRSLLDYRSNLTFTVVPAEIISYQPQNHFYFFWIDVGKKQSLTNKLPVIAFNHNGEQGLVGFIIEILKDSSLVQSILDPQTYVGVSIEGYETKAIMRGDINLKRLLFMDFINNNFTNLEGRYVYTLGIGERYPSGIQIGKIMVANDSLYGTFKNATIKPTIDFTSLRHVFVIIPETAN